MSFRLPSLAPADANEVLRPVKALFVALTLLAATCARCGVVFRDGREHGLIERQEFDPELGQLFIAHYCPACDAVREAA